MFMLHNRKHPVALWQGSLTTMKYAPSLWLYNCKPATSFAAASDASPVNQSAYTCFASVLLADVTSTTAVLATESPYVMIMTRGQFMTKVQYCTNDGTSSTGHPLSS